MNSSDDLASWLERRLLEQRVALEGEHKVLVADLRLHCRACGIDADQSPPHVKDVSNKNSQSSAKISTLSFQPLLARGTPHSPGRLVDEGTSMEKEIDTERDRQNGNDSRHMLTDKDSHASEAAGILYDPRAPRMSRRVTTTTNGTAPSRPSCRTSMILYIPPEDGTIEVDYGNSIYSKSRGIIAPIMERVSTRIVDSRQQQAPSRHRFSSRTGESPRLTCMQRAVHSVWFDLASAMAIIVNTFLLALQAHFLGMEVANELGEDAYGAPAHMPWQGSVEMIRRLDALLTVIFIIELLMRLCADRTVACCSPWIWFDAVIVSFGVLEIADANPMLGFNPTLMRLARLARMMRVLRIIRIIRYFDSLYLLIKSIQASVGALIWSFVCLLSLQIAMGLCLTQLLQPVMDEEGRDYEQRLMVFRYFGTFLRMMVTMFEITIGNWAPSCRDLMTLSDWFGLFYILYTCCLMFAVVRVITAVFITETQRVVNNDDAIAVRQKQKEREAYLHRLKQMFKELDTSGDGYVSYDEFEAFFNDPLMKTWLATLDVNVHELEHLFRLLDTGTGEIEIEEFISGVSRLKGTASSIDVVTILKTVNIVEAKLDAILNGTMEVTRQPTRMMGHVPTKANERAHVRHLDPTVGGASQPASSNTLAGDGLGPVSCLSLSREGTRHDKGIRENTDSSAISRSSLV